MSSAVSCEDVWVHRTSAAPFLFVDPTRGFLSSSSKQAASRVPMPPLLSALQCLFCKRGRSRLPLANPQIARVLQCVLPLFMLIDEGWIGPFSDEIEALDLLGHFPGCQGVVPQAGVQIGDERLLVVSATSRW